METVLCKLGENDRVIREVSKRQASVMRGRNVSMEVKRCLRNNILLLTYGLEIWKWNRA